MALASRGLRDMDDGAEAIEDARELATVRRQAGTVLIKAGLWAAALTAASLLIPA